MHRLNGILMETIQGWSLAPGEMRTAVWLGLTFRSQAGDVFFLQGNLQVVIKQKDGAAGVQGSCTQRWASSIFFAFMVSLNQKGECKCSIKANSRFIRSLQGWSHRSPREHLGNKSQESWNRLEKL